MKTKVSDGSKQSMMQYEDLSFNNNYNDQQRNNENNQDPSRYSSNQPSTRPLNEYPFNTDNLHQVDRDLPSYSQQQKDYYPSNPKPKSASNFNSYDNYHDHDNEYEEQGAKVGLDHYHQYQRQSQPVSNYVPNREKKKISNIFSDNTNSDRNTHYVPSVGVKKPATRDLQHRRADSIEEKLNQYHNIDSSQNQPQNQGQQPSHEPTSARRRIPSSQSVSNPGQNMNLNLRDDSPLNSIPTQNNAQQQEVSVRGNQNYPGRTSQTPTNQGAFNLNIKDVNHSKLALLNKKLKNKDTARHKLLNKEKFSTNSQVDMERHCSVDKENIRNSDYPSSKVNRDSQVAQSSITTNAKRARSQSNNGNQSERASSVNQRNFKNDYGEYERNNSGSNDYQQNDNNQGDQRESQMNNQRDNRRDQNEQPTSSQKNVDNHSNNKPSLQKNQSTSQKPKTQNKNNDLESLDINKQNETNEIPEQADQPINLIMCSDCGRKFNPNALEKHRKICKKVFVEKRKEFDTKKVRNAEIEQELEKLEGFAKQNLKSKKKLSKNSTKETSNQPSSRGGGERPLKKLPKWKQQSEQFRRAMRCSSGADEVSGYNLKGLPADYQEEDDRKQCSFCNRKFNPETLTRHQPFCKEKNSQKNTMKFKVK